MVPMDARGISRQKIIKIGMDASDTAQLFFDDVRVPARNVIGQEGMGFTYQMLQFQEERLWGAASSLRMMDNMIDQTIAYTRERQASASRSSTTRWCISGWPNCAPRSRRCAP
jgi:citronellyl-CoA dehydrogenase